MLAIRLGLVAALATLGSVEAGCPAYRAKYSKSKYSSAFVTPVVTQTAYGKNGATFQLSVNLKGQAASLYSIHGTSKGPLSMPPAYQSSKSPLVGAPNPLYKQGDDSYLTIGLPYVKKQIAASPKFPAWTASKGLSSKNAAVFWMNPKAAPSHGKSILVAQVTVKVPCSKKWSAEMGMTGYKLNGKAWRDDDVVFAWSKFAMPKPGCPVYIPPSTKRRNGRFVNTIVTQTAYGKNGATFQLAVKLKGQAASLYSIHGTERGDLSMPPAYQSSKSPLVGAPNPLYKQGDDSYLTVGLPYVNKKQIAATAMPKWTANVALHTSNSAVFWMNPRNGPKAGKPIVVAQVTVKVPCTKLWAAEMGLSGYLRNGKQWRDDKVAFVWSKFKAGCKAPAATKKCPSYCSNFKKSKSGRYATPTVTQTGFGSNGATFQLTATLKGAARNLYSVHGTASGALILPPAYQSSKSPAVGGPNPIFRQGDDSYITVGLALNNKQIARTPNFPSWNARRGVESNNAAIFWMNPSAGPKKGKPILVAQITVPVPCSKSWSVVMGLTGYLSNGKTWRDDSVVFAWSKFKMSGKKCPADVEYKKGPGVVNVEDLLVILSAFGSKCPSQVSCEVDIETKRSPGEITVEDLLAVLSAFGMPCGKPSAPPPPPPPPANTACVASKSCGLFFSEVAEGSGHNKYLQIYNPTNKDISLTGYAFPSAANGARTRGKHEYWNSFKKGAKVKSQGVYTICHPQAHPKIKAICDQEHRYLSNGDDAYCLVKGSKASYSFIDCIGDYGKDPGRGYTVCGKKDATQDNILMRKCKVRVGNQGVATSKNTAAHFTGWAKSAGTSGSNCEWYIAPKDFWNTAKGHREMINHFLC